MDNVHNVLIKNMITLNSIPFTVLSKAIVTCIFVPSFIVACSSDPAVSQQENSVSVIQNQKNTVDQTPQYNTASTPASTPARNTQPKINNNAQNNYSNVQNNNNQPKNNYTGAHQAQNYFNFADWQADFSRRAMQRGYNANDVQKLMSNANYNSRIVSLDNNQAEFVKMPWQYVENAVSAAKVKQGRKKHSAHNALLQRIEDRFGVPSHIVSSIWGIESAYGAVTGKANLASSLSTLAYEGRRRTFAENQLFSLLGLLGRGDVSWYNLNGSWAGGMGQTQFIPATWAQQGVDGDGDGRRNPWSTSDSLASTANYLRSAGWVYGLEPFYEVQLPDYFNYEYVGQNFTVAQWRSLNIYPMNGSVSGLTQAKLWLPAGKNGPALLITQNFDAIKVYNNSNNYALGVSLLAKRINYQSGLQKAWPKYERPLTKAQVTQLQQRLTTLGYDTNGVDGVIGSNTRKAFRRWQMDNGQVADGFITRNSTSVLVW